MLGSITFFDIATVLAFAGVVAAYFLVVDADQKLLPQFLLCGVAFAIANQLGNHDLPLLGAMLLASGIAYAIILCRR